MEEREYGQLRAQMVEEILTHASLAGGPDGPTPLDPRVLEVMGRVPRHEFVPLEVRPYAYVNAPLPVGYGKTISQPFINALMTGLLDPGPAESVLEVGTGMGYQAALLAELAGHVYTVELIEELAALGRQRLARRGYRNVSCKVGDGSRGWVEHAPFDKIMVTAAPDLIPAALIHQLKPGGRMVIPAGIADAQQLMVVEKTAEGRVRTRDVLAVRFSELVVEEA